jgi:hypothetical protein
MSPTTFAGIFCVGLVFGYLLYYSVRHTKEFSIDLLASALGAVGGGTVVALLGKTDEWIGPYGLGLGVGFLGYLGLSLLLILKGKFGEVASTGVMLGKAMLGKTLKE